MNRILKVFIIFTFAIIAIIFMVGAVLFYKLPSAKTFASVVASTKKPELLVKENAQLISKTFPNSSETNKASSEDSSVDASKVSTKNIISEKFLDDMMSIDRPLSDFCKSLAQAKAGAFSTTDFNKAFAESFEASHPDPRIQAAKPLLRYVFRLPRMQQLINDLEEVADQNEESFVDKAQFYTAAFSAYSEMKQHQADMESILDRSYLFMGLNNLIAKKPELVNSPRVQSFCLNTETLFNEAAVVDFESEKNNFLSLLQDANISAKDISFNPAYKSNIIFNFDGQSLTFSGGWLDDLIKPEATTSSR